MKILIFIAIIVSLTACKQHTVNTIQSLSRESTTVQFSKSKKPYKAKEEVGGEQINTTTIKAKANETYLIEVSADNDSLQFYIDGSSLDIQIVDNNPLKKKVTTQTQTDIELSFTAHPDSSVYHLKIKKL